ncbi:MAG: hypothetical protein OEZ13_13760, partial [Spirochaetia bacterium]|nr:hypothetical protein [Spirochaetia bacterium]
MKPKIIHITYICLLFILFVSAILSCYHDEDIEKNYLILSEWEVKIDKEWKKSGVIFWEASEEKGGINAKKHDGFGEYRIFYKVPEFLKGSQLAFFTECLDDADNTYFNNELIGKTGRMPKIKDGKIDVSSFQTGTRKARLYLLPQKSLLYDSTNEIRINIYDFAGNGGFCYPQKPLIGRYENLREKARFYQMSNDLPRFVLLTVLLFMIAYCGTKLFKEQDIKFRSVGVQFLERLNFWSFIIRRKKSVVKDNIIKENIYFHKFCGLLIFVMFFFNITEEVHFKDSFISSGEFWFRTKIIVSYSTMFILIALLHSETFGYSLEKKFSHLMNILTVFFGIITHPLFSFFL